jgi:4-hydroxymandelate oxidase
MPTSVPSSFASLSELESIAAARTAPGIWDYIQGAAGEERTLRANRGAFERRALRPRLLADVSLIDPTTTVLGQKVSVPFFVSPTAYQASVHPEGESGTATACSAARVLAVFSTLSSHSLTQIAAAAPAGPRWFQLYLQPDPRVTDRLLQQAERSGYSAIVLTADVPLLGIRDRQARTGFALDSPVPIGNGADVVSPARGPTRDGDRFRLRAETASTWEVLKRIEGTTRLPIVVKGVLTAEDARRAVDHGARGLVVSNHGGRQLDGVAASLDALPEVVEEVGREAEVYLDGGVRRGSDVLAALALGARAVGIGRPVLWALAVGGAAGVAQYLELLRTDLVNAMAQAGRRSVAEVDPALVGGRRRAAPAPRSPRRPTTRVRRSDAGNDRGHR